MPDPSSTRQAAPARGVWVLLALVVLGAALLRLSGLDRLQPQLVEPDSYLVLQTRLYRAGQADREKLPKGFYAYPVLLSRLVAALTDGAEVEPGTPPTDLRRAHLAAAGRDYVRVRFLVALLSLLLVPATYALARRFLDPPAALLAAALVATSLLHLLFSQQARPHGAHATFALLGILAAIGLRERPTWGRHVLAALAACAAVATLHNGAFLVFPLLAAVLLRERTDGAAPRWAGLLPFAGLAAGVAFYPRPPTLEGEAGLLEFGGHTLYLKDIDGRGAIKAARFLWDHDPTLAVLAGLGAIFVLARVRRSLAAAEHGRRRDLAVVLAYVVPYGIALCLYKETAERFLLPVLPFLACVAAAPLNVLAGRGRALPAGLAAAALAFPLYADLRFASVRAAPDTLEQAAEWVLEHTDREDLVLLTPTLALPVLFDEPAVAAASEDFASGNQQWIAYQIEHRQAGRSPAARRVVLTPVKLANKGRAGQEALLAWFEAQDADYVVFEVSRRMMFLALVRELHDRIAERGTLVAEFRGEDASYAQERPLDYQDVPDLVGRLLDATAFGPAIEIWRLRDE